MIIFVPPEILKYISEFFRNVRTLYKFSVVCKRNYDILWNEPFIADFVVKFPFVPNYWRASLLKCPPYVSNLFSYVHFQKLRFHHLIQRGDVYHELKTKKKSITSQVLKKLFKALQQKKTKIIIEKLNSYERFLVHSLCESLGFHKKTISHYEIETNVRKTKCDCFMTVCDGWHGYTRVSVGDMAISLYPL